jgi:hypothetical protein
MKVNPKLATLATDLTQMCLDITGLFDPTPVSDTASALISLGRGQWLDAALSGVSLIPYVGDLAKAGKFPKYLKTLENAIALAAESAENASLITPIIQRLDQALRLLPDTDAVKRLRLLVERYLSERRVARLATVPLPDISNTFYFDTYARGAYTVQEAGGRLGVPGKVMKHRSQTAQRGVSAGTGDDAGHLIGNRFGAPGDDRNLTLQQWESNRFGSFKDLENRWAEKLEGGTGVEVLVQDVSHPKYGDRPFKRRVTWTETDPDGKVTFHEETFMNPHSERSRTAQGIESTVDQPQLNSVVHVDFAQRMRITPGLGTTPEP